MQQYKVPQNVDIEDKVIAGLTLKQFIYIIVAGGIVLMLKYALPASAQFLFMPLGIIIGSAGVALAFVKINERPLEVFILSAAKTLVNPNQRVWQKEGLKMEEKAPEVKKDDSTKKQNVSEIRSNLERLAMIVDSGAHSLAEERTTNVKSTATGDPAKINDMLADTETPSERLNKFMNDAKKSVATQKKEPPISTLASIDPAKTKFDYKKIETTNDDELEEIVEKVQAKEALKDAAIESATIEKF